MGSADRTERSAADVVLPPSVNFAAAQAAVERLTREYPAAARRNLQAIRDRFAEFPGADPQEAMKELRRFAHNFTGQGASFNYPLITEIADSLRGYLRACGVASAVRPPYVEAHFDALQAVLDGALSGDGGPEGAAILARLRDADPR